MNTIANMHPEGREEGNDIVERMLSNDKTMESIAKLKDALNGSAMSEMINTVIEQHNKHGRKLQELFISEVTRIIVSFGLVAVILFLFPILFPNLEQFCEYISRV